MPTLSRQCYTLAAALFIAGCSEEVGVAPGQGRPSTDARGGAATGSAAKNTGDTNGKGGKTTTTQKTGAGGRGGATTGAGGGPAKGGSIESEGGSEADATDGRDSKGGSSDSTIGGSGKGGGLGTGGRGFGTGVRSSRGGNLGAGGGSIGLGTGGRSASVGRASGGKAATGGDATSSGTPTTITSTCTEGQKTLSNNGTGKHCGYTYEYWKDSGSGSLVLKADGFSVDWSNINNLLGRKGVRPGTGNEVVDYDANYQPNGNSYLCIYGWFKNPLVEYYIVDSWGNWRPPGGQGLQGSVTCDGGEYDLYKVPRTGPSIEGNGAFTQYWSVRKQKQTSGTITVGCHFSAWKSKGMSIGSFYEVSMTVEGYQSSGKADVKFVMK